MSTLPRRPFGTTGIEVSAIGLGGGQIGDLSMSDQEVERLLDEALACGINLVDTARSYGASEERIGRFLRGRRREDIVLSTKIGYGIPDVPDWTPECIRRGVDAARARLGVDVIDIVHLHSCPREVLESSGVVDALDEAVRAGKIRVAAYSARQRGRRACRHLRALRQRAHLHQSLRSALGRCAGEGRRSIGNED